MPEPVSSRPDNGGDVFTVRGLHAFFSLWLSALEKFYEERDRRYEDRFEGQDKSVTNALTAQDKQTTAAFASSEKAILKAEESQTSYNQSHNDLLKKMDEQHKDTLPRPEAESRFRQLDEKMEDLKTAINDLRLSRSEGQGIKVAEAENKAQSQWVVGLVMSLPATVMAIILLIILVTKA